MDVAQDLRQNAYMMEGMSPFEAFSGDETKYLSAGATLGEAICHGTTTLGDDGPNMEGAL